MSNHLQSPTQQRLDRPVHDRRIAGVCSGMAEYFNIDPIFVRIGFIALIFGGIGIPLYPLLWLVMPSKNQKRASWSHNFGEMRAWIVQSLRSVGSLFRSRPQQPRFDPMTGQPLQSRFDPMTGQPRQANEIPVNNIPTQNTKGSLSKQQQTLAFGLVGLGVLLGLPYLGYLASMLLPVLIIGAGIFLFRRAQNN